jgi:hypothetical protein
MLALWIYLYLPHRAMHNHIPSITMKNVGMAPTIIAQYVLT